ncbi:MAG: RHS repeat-associated core domain-containing protein [Pirellulales bacterium]|nr:RHS repeat-associated core domain-containing protein [Pirellulales bacterium]
MLYRRYLAALDRVFAQENLFVDDSVSNTWNPNGAPVGTYWLIQDRLGTVRNVIDNNRVIWNHAQFDAFGNRVSLDYPHTNPATPLDRSLTRIGFTGQEYDEVTGLTWYSNGDGNGNWYDPRTNTWIKRDALPVRSLNPNAYVYAANGPTNFIDPSGQEGGEAGAYNSRFEWHWNEWAKFVLLSPAFGIVDSIVRSHNPAEAAKEVAQGFKTGTKAVVNGVAIAGVKTVTLCQCGDGLELIGVTDEDRALGYDTAVQFSTASGEILIGVVSGGTAAALKNGGTLAKTASGAIDILDAAGNVVGVVKGVQDASSNGFNLSNGAQIAGSALGLAGNATPLRKGADVPSAPKKPNPAPKVAPCQALPAPNRTRLPQDVAVNPKAPPAKQSGSIGTSEAQQAALARDIRRARAEGATDIRVNQEQVNAAMERVGINRPDLQYTRPDGTRVYIEYDTSTPGSFPNSPRGPLHAERIMANDPSGVVITNVIN